MDPKPSFENNRPEPLQKSDRTPPKEIQHDNPYSSGRRVIENTLSDLVRGPKLPEKPEVSIKKPEAKPEASAPVKKPEPVPDNWFKGRSQFYRHEVERYFKTPKGRLEFQKALGLPLSDTEKLKEEKNDTIKMIPYRFGGAIDRSEAKRSLLEENWKIRRESKKPYKTANWKKEKKERGIEDKERDFLKKKFGIK